jgi:toxin YoeB
LGFTDNAWEDYVFWQETDKKILKKINQLLRDVLRNPYDGLGKAEALKRNLRGKWSRRITDEHRLVYEVLADRIIVHACRFHYD